jgi:hypothetical protein
VPRAARTPVNDHIPQYPAQQAPNIGKPVDDYRDSKPSLDDIARKVALDH